MMALWGFGWIQVGISSNQVVVPAGSDEYQLPSRKADASLPNLLQSAEAGKKPLLHHVRAEVISVAEPNMALSELQSIQPLVTCQIN